MKVKGNKTTKVNIVTLGCSKNLVDSENLLTQLRGNGIEAEHESKKDNSNVVIINTCGFIDNAKQESIDTILRYVDAKENGLIDKIYVSGCLSQRYKDDLEREMPQVDAFFGSNELPAILKKFKADYKHELIGERLLTTPSHYAYVKIAEGCDRPCSFCAIPVMRGVHVSTPMEDLVKQAKNMAAKGTKELILIAQDLTYYGLDIYKKRNLSDLLKNLSDVEGIDWIRLQYAYPSGFPLDVLDVMAERSNICKYIDMPLQHGSTEMLKLMRRGIDRPKTEDLIKTIRDKVPGIAFRTTMIIGHPGETEKEFDELRSFVEEQRFDRLGAFTYSHEEHTHSYSMEDTIPQEVKEERQAEIMAIQEGISAELNEAKIGNTYKVLFDRKEGGYFIGRTEHDSPEVDNEVMVSAKDQYVRVGDFANVKINDAAEFDLFGEIVK
ncbi:30S ribosomal protein S12 methylthiotransferase RimO [uncultured Cytophaga sp.]|uniref:30S ribosomal protein S12 methylthiotransferase RimO n=1 Tax=uncultured Cytophaga sp. TaxID=160238 RepID=UPI0026334250|nr:30S ribosomal protein S12 methylthiotransferase RimO [uncultured Cytophaga sp.]